MHLNLPLFLIWNVWMRTICLIPTFRFEGGVLRDMGALGFMLFEMILNVSTDCQSDSVTD